MPKFRTVKFVKAFSLKSSCYAIQYTIYMYNVHNIVIMCTRLQIDSFLDKPLIFIGIIGMQVSNSFIISF